jgi:hypothetical protein
MPLLTKTLKQTIPALESTKREKDLMVWVKFVAPWSQWTWSVIAFDGKDTCFGWIERDEERKLDFFSLSELQSERFWGLKIERDKDFTPCRLSAVKNTVGA